jgi:hypothetical protein
MPALEAAAPQPPAPTLLDPASDHAALVAAWRAADAAYESYRTCNFNVYGSWLSWQRLVAVAASLGERPE